MDKQNLGRKNLSPFDTCGNGVTLSPELPVDQGTWLKIEEDASSPGINSKICKKALVSLHVTLEDPEHECSVAPYCKNHPIRKCLKDQEKTKGKNHVF